MLCAAIVGNTQSHQLHFEPREEALFYSFKQCLRQGGAEDMCHLSTMSAGQIREQNANNACVSVCFITWR